MATNLTNLIKQITERAERAEQYEVGRSASATAKESK